MLHRGFGIDFESRDNNGASPDGGADGKSIFESQGFVAGVNEQDQAAAAFGYGLDGGSGVFGDFRKGGAG